MHKIEKIYKEIRRDEEKEIYVEGFTPEQIYYQIEDLCNEIITEAEQYLMGCDSSSKDGDKKGECTGDGDVGDECCEEECREDDSTNEHDTDDIITEHDDLSSSSSSSPSSTSSSLLVVENVGTDYSDASSVDEDTYSEDEENLDVDDLKNKPASSLFKVLDKNIRK